MVEELIVSLFSTPSLQFARNSSILSQMEVLVLVGGWCDGHAFHLGISEEVHFREHSARPSNASPTTSLGNHVHDRPSGS